MVLDGDVDGSFPYLNRLTTEFPQLRPMLIEPNGQLRALDEGVARSTSDVVLLMDDDVIAGPGLVSGHARRHRAGRPLVVMGAMPVRLAGGEGPATRLYARDYDGHCQKIESGELAVLEGLWLGNVSVRRGDLVKVGVWSEGYRLHWHSDLDLGLRLAQNGLDGVFDPTLRATHMHMQSNSSFLRAGHERGEAVTVLEHQYPQHFAVIRPAPVLDGLPAPARRVVSYLGREGVAQRSGRMLMTVSSASDRLGSTRMSDASAKLARRIQILCGTRCATSATER